MWRIPCNSANIDSADKGSSEFVRQNIDRRFTNKSDDSSHTETGSSSPIIAMYVDRTDFSRDNFL